MYSASLSYLPIWVISFGALWIGLSHSDHSLANLYIGLGVLGTSVASALALQHRRISELEKKLRLYGYKED